MPSPRHGSSTSTSTTPPKVKTPPSAPTPPTSKAQTAHARRRLRAFANEAAALRGVKGDAKLKRAIAIINALVADGYHPIMFCRYIPTADYLAEHLTVALAKSHPTARVEAVTGNLPPEEREARVRDLTNHDGPRLLVATDCLSEGINLQDGFTAVVHYDLAWNPTRHEQREGRVDRFGQRRTDRPDGHLLRRRQQDRRHRPRRAHPPP